MSLKTTKIWGTTVLIIKNPHVEVHRAEINKGGVCSEHYHTSRYNTFIVETGKLLIRQFRDNGIVDETILEAGDYLESAPMERHQFEALEDTVLYEVYYTHWVDGEDITRFSTGYMKSNDKS